MASKRRIITVILFPTILGLAFLSGQAFFYLKQGNAFSPSPVPLDGSGIKPLNYTGAGLVLVSGENRFNVGPQAIETWNESYARSYTGKKSYRINREKIRSYLQSLSPKINAEPVSARFSINSGKITEFAPAQNGLALNISESLTDIVSAITQKNGSSQNNPDGKTSVELVVDVIEPELTLDKVNDLGIDVLLGQGESNFTGSSNARASNVRVGSNTFNGILLKAGQEFSFNQFLGPVDAASGYLPEIVIRGGVLTPEYGGGLCQVSTTLFRATLAAGLTILERRPHSIPVRYYNPQGFDATIYPGFSDFRFKNDTSAYILIQSKIVGSKLYFEVYGTDDGRKVTIDGPHQYDVRSNGALKATLTRTIRYADGTEKKDVFNSSYNSNSAFPTARNPLE
jgi:vancomycin resistance protein YoaR